MARIVEQFRFLGVTVFQRKFEESKRVIRGNDGYEYKYYPLESKGGCKYVERTFAADVPVGDSFLFVEEVVGGKDWVEFNEQNRNLVLNGSNNFGRRLRLK